MDWTDYRHQSDIPSAAKTAATRPSVNLDRMLDSQKTVLNKFEGNDKESLAEAVDENMFFHRAIKHTSLLWALLVGKSD
jgi:hypothetical protein